MLIVELLRTFKYAYFIPEVVCLLMSFFVMQLYLYLNSDFRCGALLFVVIHVIYKYKNR